MVFNCHSLFNEAAYLAALRRLRSPFAVRDADSKQSKTKIYEKTHLLLRISAVIGRVQEFPTASLDFTEFGIPMDSLLPNLADAPRNAVKCTNQSYLVGETSLFCGKPFTGCFRLVLTPSLS